MTNEGNKLTQEILKAKGFVKEMFHDGDGDEIKIWSKEGINIYEDSWWLKELDPYGTLLAIPKSLLDENETIPEIKFHFATYVKGDGSFKGGWGVLTDQQLDNIYFSLTNMKL